MKFLFHCLMTAMLLLLSPAAKAEVVATFYSHDLDDHFPHALIVVKGTVDSSGEVVDTNYGFTAVNVSPAILWGSVKGKIETQPVKYVDHSDPHFSIRLTEEQYGQLLALIEEWRNLPGKSYNLNKRNCVHFVMEAAALLGLEVNRESKLMKKPKSFLLEVMKLNPELGLAVDPEPNLTN